MKRDWIEGTMKREARFESSSCERAMGGVVLVVVVVVASGG